MARRQDKMTFQTACNICFNDFAETCQEIWVAPDAIRCAPIEALSVLFEAQAQGKEIPARAYVLQELPNIAYIWEPNYLNRPQTEFDEDLIINELQKYINNEGKFPALSIAMLAATKVQGPLIERALDKWTNSIEERPKLDDFNWTALMRSHGPTCFKNDFLESLHWPTRIEADLKKIRQKTDHIKYDSDD